MENILLKGKQVADRITEKNIAEVEKLKSEDREPCLAVLRVGNREDDMSYEKGITSRMGKTGINLKKVVLDEGVSESEYIKTLEELNDDKNVDGILCFRPLPKNLDESKIKYIIKAHKDVDCFNPVNMSKILFNEKDALKPCTPQAVIEILKHYNVELEGKKVKIVGRSTVVGKPLALLVLNENATVTICHTRTKNLKEELQSADIVIAAAGVGKFVKNEWIGDNTTVIDVGINFTEEGKMCGDVDFENLDEKGLKITPVPGGVGAVTTSVLANNVIRAYYLNK